MAEVSGRRERITVIDDHPEFLDLMRELLGDRFDVAAFTGSEITPEDIVDSRPNLLVVDLRLGTHDLQGAEVVALVRAHRHLRTVPILVCSADAGALTASADELLEAGNIAVLAKPFTLDDLEKAVRQGLNGGFPDGSSTRRHTHDSLLVRSTDAILIANAAGRYLDANDVALRLLGLTLDELRGLSVSDIVSAERGWIDGEWRSYLREHSWHGEVDLSIRGEGTRRMLATARVVDNGGQPLYVAWLQPMVEQVAG